MGRATVFMCSQVRLTRCFWHVNFKRVYSFILHFNLSISHTVLLSSSPSRKKWAWFVRLVCERFIFFIFCITIPLFVFTSWPLHFVTHSSFHFITNSHPYNNIFFILSCFTWCTVDFHAGCSLCFAVLVCAARGSQVWMREPRAGTARIHVAGSCVMRNALGGFHDRHHVHAPVCTWCMARGHQAAPDYVQSF